MEIGLVVWLTWLWWNRLGLPSLEVGVDLLESLTFVSGWFLGDEGWNDEASSGRLPKGTDPTDTTDATGGAKPVKGVAVALGVCSTPDAILSSFKSSRFTSQLYHLDMLKFVATYLAWWWAVVLVSQPLSQLFAAPHHWTSCPRYGSVAWQDQVPQQVSTRRGFHLERWIYIYIYI